MEDDRDSNVLVRSFESGREALCGSRGNFVSGEIFGWSREFVARARAGGAKGFWSLLNFGHRKLGFSSAVVGPECIYNIG
jgi:hypothetical protein